MVTAVFHGDLPLHTMPSWTLFQLSCLGWLTVAHFVQLRDNMPRLVEAVQSAGQIVTWVCDPMHGNTESVAGYKTRRYERIRQEVRSLA